MVVNEFCDVTEFRNSFSAIQDNVVVNEIRVRTRIWNCFRTIQNSMVVKTSKLDNVVQIPRFRAITVW